MNQSRLITTWPRCTTGPFFSLTRRPDAGIRLGFGTSFRSTSKPQRLPFDLEIAISTVSFQVEVIHTGRLVLSELRRQNICRRICQINRILALARLARKRAWIVINLITCAGHIATSFGGSVDQTEVAKSSSGQRLFGTV